MLLLGDAAPAPAPDEPATGLLASYLQHRIVAVLSLTGSGKQPKTVLFMANDTLRAHIKILNHVLNCALNFADDISKTKAKNFFENKTYKSALEETAPWGPLPARKMSLVRFKRQKSTVFAFSQKSMNGSSIVRITH